jgi:hypothetical protein
VGTFTGRPLETRRDRHTGFLGGWVDPTADLDVLSCHVKKDNVYIKMFQASKLSWLNFLCPNYVKCVKHMLQLSTFVGTRQSVCYFVDFGLFHDTISNSDGVGWNDGKSDESLIENNL